MIAVKPPCTNGTPEDKQPVARLSEAAILNAQSNIRYKIEGYTAARNNWTDIIIIDTFGGPQIRYEDVVATIQTYELSKSTKEIDALVIEILQYIVENPDDEDDFWEIFEGYVDPCKEAAYNVQTFGRCYIAISNYYYLMCEDYNYDYTQDTKEYLADLFNSIAIDAMKESVEDRRNYIEEHIEAGFY